MSIPFPTTHATWRAERVRAAPDEARTHVMRRYTEPLCAYARASSLRMLGEPSEIVNDFLVARLSDGAYLSRWTESGLPLRRWLANGLVIHARNMALAARRRNDLLARTSLDEAEQAAALRASDHETAALLALERAWAIRVVTEAHEQIRTELQAEGHGAWWELFRLHTVHGMPYAKAGPIVGVPVTSASSAHRQVVDRLRAALCAILERDGVRGDDIEQELASLHELLG